MASASPVILMHRRLPTRSSAFPQYDDALEQLFGPFHVNLPFKLCGPTRVTRGLNQRLVTVVVVLGSLFCKLAQSSVALEHQDVVAPYLDDALKFLDSSHSILSLPFQTF